MINQNIHLTLEKARITEKIHISRLCEFRHQKQQNYLKVRDAICLKVLGDLQVFKHCLFSLNRYIDR